MSVTDAELDDLEAKAKAATQGKWEVFPGHEDYENDIRTPELRSVVTGMHSVATIGKEDAAHIAAANPETVLRLVAEVRLKERKDSIERAVSLCDTFLAVKGMPQEERAAMVATVLEVMRGGDGR